jgi:hypothetical protein
MRCLEGDEQPRISNDEIRKTLTNQPSNAGYATLTAEKNLFGQTAMPTIEIIAVNAQHLPALPEYARFAWRGESELVSDRGLFQPVLDRLSGVIVHLGDRFDHPEEPSWFCGHIIKNRPVEEDWTEFQFEDDAKTEVGDLLRRMRDASPNQYVIFLTDFQFGPDEPLEQEFDSLEAFWARHDAHKLRHNTLYHVRKKQ